MANPLLQHYIKLTEFLGQALGPDYEVALHDLTDKNRSIIAIANNHVSGREIGAPLTNVALKILMDRSYETQDYRLHYPGVSAAGKTLRSSTLFIKQHGKLIGMLCINFDDSKFQALSSQLFQLIHPDNYVENNIAIRSDILELTEDAPETERFNDSVTSVAQSVIQEVLSEDGVPVDRLTQAEKIRIVSQLEQRGVFRLRGAVDNVSKALRSSPASIYRYLTRIRSEKEESF